MTLYHATKARNVASIMRHGLLVKRADSAAKIKGVWLHTKAMTPWAILHTQRKHKASLEQVVILEVKVRREALRRFRRGLWYVSVDIKPSALRAHSVGVDHSRSVS